MFFRVETEEEGERFVTIVRAETRDEAERFHVEAWDIPSYVNRRVNSFSTWEAAVKGE